MSIAYETAASLRVSGETLVPEVVTGLLGRGPDYSYIKGQPMPLPNGRLGPATRQGMWSIKVPRSRPGDLNRQIIELLGSVTGDLEIWKDLTSNYAVDLFYGIFITGGNQGLGLSANVLRAVGERGIDLDFDLYHDHQAD